MCLHWLIPCPSSALTKQSSSQARKGSQLLSPPISESLISSHSQTGAREPRMMRTSSTLQKPPRPGLKAATQPQTALQSVVQELLGHNLPCICVNDAASLRLTFLLQKMEIPVLTSWGCYKTLDGEMYAEPSALCLARRKGLIIAPCCYCY